MTSTLISRASVAVLLVAGLMLLFAPEIVLSRLIAGYPAAGLWLGQVLGAAWLGVAALNWLNRSAVLGGIYGRPTVMGNLILHFISALVILKAAQRAGFPGMLCLLAASAAVLAIAYGVLLLRGPFAADASAQGVRQA
ncbi:MAG: hypothetical protein H7Z74_15925 [Anaerolineae bacterium]|nr:hypothetical protein [Gemmatimonadaceae bacterium]